MDKILQVNNHRHLLSMLITFLIAFVVNYFWAQTTCFLIPFTAVFVMQTSIGNSFYQGVRNMMLVILIIAVAALTVVSYTLFYQMIHDVLIGSILGISMNVLLLPRRPDIEFRENVLPVIKNFNDYFSMITDQLLQQDSSRFNNDMLEKTLLKLPDWVYKRGFDGALQVGYRFFLMKIEQISDVLFSMHHLARYEYDKELLAKIRPVLLQYVEHVNQFFVAVITVLELKELTEEPSDLEKEITDLQNQFFAVVPSSLELLDMRRDYVNLAAFIFALKDLRKLLLKLGESLR